MSRDTVTTAPPTILWVDGVGGFLVLRGTTASLGPGFCEPLPDVPILADLSRNHAAIRRDGEGYWLSADRPTTVNLAPVQRALLRSGDRITLGASCQLSFHQPEPLSATARLTLISGHRFSHPVDAVLLMAETMTLDRSPQAHIQTPDLRQRAVIFRQGDQLALKASCSIRANGQAQRDRAVLTPGTPTSVEDLTITLEELL
jgi:hypothetical protein